MIKSTLIRIDGVLTRIWLIWFWVILLSIQIGISSCFSKTDVRLIHLLLLHSEAESEKKNENYGN